MRLGVFSAQTSPIAIDFGTSSVKALQIQPGEKPTLVAAAQLEIPHDIRQQSDQLFDFYQRELPVLLHKSRFKGKRVVCGIPSSHSFIQHMQVTPMNGMSTEDLIRAQLQTQMKCSPQSIVVRVIEVTEKPSGSQAKQEVICLAVARDTVMRYVNLLNKSRLEVVGAHTEIMSIVRAFDHIHRRAGDDEVATLYVDLGWGGTRVAVAHGKKIVFARYIQIGGRHFDQHIASTLHCDMASAHAHRLSLRDSSEFNQASSSQHETGTKGAALLNVAMAQSNMSESNRRKKKHQATAQAERRVGQAPPELTQSVTPESMQQAIANVDLSELLDTVTDELSMCIRYHQGKFPDRRIERAIFLGGESGQMWLCRHVVKAVRLNAQLGDPLARVEGKERIKTPGLTLDQPLPGWATVYGLCTASADS